MKLDWKNQVGYIFTAFSHHRHHHSSIEGKINHEERESKRTKFPPGIVTKAVEGDATAQLELGKIFSTASSLQKNCEIAFDWISRSAEQGNMEAQFILGDLYALGHGTSKSVPGTYKCYTEAAIQGYERALIRIHCLYQQDIRMHCRGQINSEEKEWSNDSFKKYNHIRELNEYRLEQNRSILNGIIAHYTSKFKHYQSSNQKNPVVQLNLAFLYQHGYGVKKCIRWAMEYYTLAAEQGNVNAQYNLGGLYEKHTNIKFNYRHAFKWYTESAQGGNRNAQKSLAYFYLKGLTTDIDYSVALSWYTKAAEAGDSEAQVILGKLYRKGEYTKKDLQMAVKWYSQAARQGNIVAQNCLSQLHECGMLNNIDLEEDMSVYTSEDSMNSRLRTKLSVDISKLGGLHNFKQLSELGKRALIGDGQAMYEIGLAYLNGDKEFDQYQDTGITWIKNAAYAKHKGAQIMIADLYRKGGPIEQDYHKANIWYRTLAKQKNVYAQYNVGILYNEGLGVRQDPLEASKWFIWASDQENSDAQFNLGMLRLDGRGLRQDKKEGLELLFKAAQQRNIQACYKLGSFYFYGRYYAVKDTEKGLKLLRFAADNDHIESQFELAGFYKKGNSIKRDIRKHVEYLNMAANLGSPEAQYQLALIYLHGYSNIRDYMEAYAMFKKAKVQGHEQAGHIFRFPIEYHSDIDDYSKILDMFIEVTKKGIDTLHYHIGAIYELGVRASEWTGLNVDYTKAREWYLNASKIGDSRADYRLGIMNEYERGVEKNPNTAMAYYKNACIKGSSAAAYRLACIYLDNYHVEQDLLDAFHYYSVASTMGHQEASKALTISTSNNDILLCNNASIFLDPVIRIHKEIKIAMLEKATERRYAGFQHDIGLMYEKEHVDSNAIKWFSFAANVGVTDAYYRLGVIHEEGRGTRQDYGEAARMYQKAAEKEHEDSCYRLGQLYQYGKGIKLDCLKAYHFYKKAADLGHESARKVLNITLDNKTISNGFFSPSSQAYQDSLLMCMDVAKHGNTEIQFQTGFAYEYSLSKSNYLEAYKWYSMAAKGLHREAIYHLGLLYEKGLGVSYNYRMASQLYYQASKLGSGDAFYQLGKVYHYGKDIVIDPTKAVECYTLAAELGNPEYQCELGRLYEEGELVPIDLLESLKWYTKAYLQGDDNISLKIYSMYQDKPYETFFFKRLFKNLSAASCGYFRLNEEYRYLDYGRINNQLGALCALGHGTEKDMKKACSYFSIKYSGGSHPFSVKTLLDLDYGLNSSEKSDLLKKFVDDEEFFDQIQNPEQLFQLGVIFLNGKNNSQKKVLIEKDYSKAFKCLTEAANKNHPGSMVKLGMLYCCGYGVQKDSKEGERWFDDARSDFITFTRDVALLYHTHEGMQDFKQAFKWYEYLRKDTEGYEWELGIQETIQVGFGLLFEYGDGVKQDYHEALNCYKNNAKNTSLTQLHRLALLYYYGKGVSVDYKQAFNLFLKAMDGYKWVEKLPFVYEPSYSNGGVSQNNLVYCIKDAWNIEGESHYYLGLMYKSGQGVHQDQKKSQHHFKKAFDRRCSRAKYEIVD